MRETALVEFLGHGPPARSPRKFEKQTAVAISHETAPRCSLQSEILSELR